MPPHVRPPDAPLTPMSDLSGEPPHARLDGRPPEREQRGRLALLAAALVIVLGAAGVVRMLWIRQSASVAAEARIRDATLGRGALVRTVRIGQSDPVRHVIVLGETRPFATVTLYAKVSGYLRTIRFDVGDHVREGDTIATIESPETDRALLGAKADYDNKVATADRVSQLLAQKYVSPQEADEARTEAAVAQQRMAALTEQQAYEVLKAPLSGTVTARFADPGALMQSAATSETSALPVATIAETDSLRVLVYLDQSDAAFVHAGDHVLITMNEQPGLHIDGRVARVAGELDPKTRKMLAEVDVGDRTGAIVPGSFVQVQVDVPTLPHPQATADALTVRDGQTMVAFVGGDGVVHFRPVSVISNDGRTVVFDRGVAVGDRVALDIGSGVADGSRVQVDSEAAVAAGAPAASTGGK
ncbi:MAG TPA: efflux RND transporter periplasmic adaptor subunit [Gemmatimonadaceae bacterium]|nr:efflux RND transporter periplasmic adaptor subunit [Gemmatimonadaceae bacterium]